MKAKLISLLTIIKAQLADIWNRSKMVLIAIAALLLTLEFKKIKEALLIYAAKKEIKKDEKTDQALAAKENAANSQADDLAKKAQNEPVNDDWYKK